MARRVPEWKRKQDEEILANGGDPTAPPGDMRRLGPVRRVYAITSLFTEHKIVEYDAVNESCGDDGKPNWETVRISPNGRGFVFLHKEEFFFDKAEAVAFAERALRAHAVYVSTFFDRLRAEHEWANHFRHKTTEYTSRALTPDAPGRKGKAKR